MHQVALALIIIVVILIVYKERFVAAFEMVIRNSRHPIDTYYDGRYDKDFYGRDWYDRTFQKYTLENNLGNVKGIAVNANNY